MNSVVDKSNLVLYVFRIDRRRHWPLVKLIEM
jgi:hypothetical protein